MNIIDNHHSFTLIVIFHYYFVAIISINKRVAAHSSQRRGDAGVGRRWRPVQLRHHARRLTRIEDQRRRAPANPRLPVQRPVRRHPVGRRLSLRRRGSDRLRGLPLRQA